MFVFSIYLWNFGKFFIFLVSSDSFNVKNDIHTFFSLFWLQILNSPASLQSKNTRIGPFPWKRSVLQNPDRERTNQSTGICQGLGLPYNNRRYFLEKPAFSRAKRCSLLVYDFRSLLGSEEREDPGNDVGRWGRLATRHLINQLWLARFDLRRVEFWKAVKLVTILRPTWFFF